MAAVGAAAADAHAGRRLEEGLQALREQVAAAGSAASAAAEAALAGERARRLEAEALARRLEREAASLREEIERLRGSAPEPRAQQPTDEPPTVSPAPGTSATQGGAAQDDERPSKAPGAAAPKARPRLHMSSRMFSQGFEECADLLELSPSGKQQREARLSRTLLERMRRKQGHWDRKPYEAVIFEGGGTKGMVYAGAIKRLAESNLLDGIKYFAGTSAGAQTAALVAVGYSGDELKDVMMTMPWDRLLDCSKIAGCCGCFPNFYRLFTQHGWCRGEVLQQYLEELISKKVGRKGFTLLDLYQERGIVLRVGACNVTTRRFELLDHKTHPNMPLSVAARASSNIPGVFVPVKYESKTRPDQKFVYVDGGLEGNIPMKSFPGKRTLAFDLMSSGDWNKEHGNFIAPEGLVHFVGIILDMVMNSAQSAGGLNEDDEEDEGHSHQDIHIVKINCGDHGMLETHMTKEQVLSMVAAGWDAVEDFLTHPCGPAASEEG